MRRCLLAILVASTTLSSSWSACAHADEIDRQLAVIAQTGPQGAGSAAARAACDELSSHRTDLVPRMLMAMETTNPVAANWYRTAFETIVERELAKANPQFPLEDLRAFVHDPKRAGRVRRLALALCDRVDKDYSKQFIPRMLDDPEFRSDAVEAALAAGQQALENGDSETAQTEFHQAFDHAREGTQTTRAASKLAGLGHKVDIAVHLGLVIDWWLVGPFDAPRFSGFARQFPPEQQVDLQAEYVGQEGRTIGWLRYRTADPLGELNLIQALGPAKEAVAYAYTYVESPREQAAQLRCGADDNCTVWLNGQKVFGRDQWLNGTRFDRFITPVQLRRGQNRILVKICQGPQHKDPQVSNNWSLQLRFCDENGAGLVLPSALREVSGVSK
ncbi:MAG: hypothetical protein HY288_18125 [Planctomycetia bacterium]|nr:hypothetical protein [Planctomycetia bacterium]